MTDKIELHPLKRDPYNRIEKVRQQGLNKEELKVALSNPMLHRVPNAVKPCILQVEIMHNHNPDFALFNYFIEVKGRFYKEAWIKMLANLKRPDRYKIILCSSNKKDRRKLANTLTRRCPEIEWAHIENKSQPWANEWLDAAIQDWITCSEADREVTRERCKRFGSLPTWMREEIYND